MAFDIKRHVIKVQGGREYLPVAARLVWFRSEHPDWGIVTTAVEINLEKQYAIFGASIFNAEGKVMATATKMENIKGFGDYLEKAETGAVGRALAYCGYGTQFAPELEEGGRFSDAPQGGNRFASGNGRAGGGGGNGFNAGGGGFNGGGGNGMTARPAAPSGGNRPASAPRPPVDEDDVFGGDDDAPPAPAPRASAAPPRPAAAPPASSGGVTRVREPERPDFDPGGPGGDDDEEDPFLDDDAPATAAAPLRAEGGPSPFATKLGKPDGQGTGLVANQCSEEGCKNGLTAGQANLSIAKFGRPLCLLHQRDAAPLAGAGSGGGGRAGAKNGADDL